MASRRRRSDAAAFVEIKTLVVRSTWIASETITISINGKSLILTVGSTVTTTSIATALKEMWNGDVSSTNATRNNTGDQIPEAQPLIAATVSGSTVTLTHNTAGTPFTISKSLSSSSGTVTLTTTQTATGPEFWG